MARKIVAGTPSRGPLLREFIVEQYKDGSFNFFDLPRAMTSAFATDTGDIETANAMLSVFSFLANPKNSRSRLAIVEATKILYSTSRHKAQGAKP